MVTHYKDFINESSDLEQGHFVGPGSAFHHYTTEMLEPEDEVLRLVRETAIRRGLPPIRLRAIDSRHLEILVRLLNARRAIEIGTLGGYSGISIARGLRPGGRLHTFELNPHDAEVARQLFSQARLLSEVVVHVGPASENLLSVQHEAPFDVIFISGDATTYPQHLVWATNHLRVGGALIADKTFVHPGLRGQASQESQRTRAAIDEFNHLVLTSGRFRSTIFPTYDGLTVAVKVN